MTEAKVVRLDGSCVPVGPEPQPDVIHELETLLQLARDGQIHGFAAALCWADETSGHVRVGVLSMAQVGQLQMLGWKILKGLQE